MPIEIAYSRLDEMIENTLQELNTQDYKIFLTDSKGNFRKTVSPEYKANRKETARPVHLPALEEYLIQSWGAIRAVNEEADDLLGIHQTQYAENCEDSIIVSIDKDLKQIPGSHYNFVKQELSEVSEDDGLFFFYKQLLMGDSTDNIAGCPGIGPKKAEKYLRPAYGNEQAIFETVWEQYKKSFPEKSSDELEELITTVGRLVYIRRRPGELWMIPQV